MIKNVMIIQLMLILVGVIYIYYNYEHREIIYRHQIRSLENQLGSADVKINKLKKIIYKYSLRYRWNVTLSGYTTEKDETKKDNTNTAITEKPIPGWTAAVSHALKILLGKRVYIQGFGIRYINDLMNSRF